MRSWLGRRAVCADAMELPPLQVHTSMRTADSLAEGVSQYMAELNRIRQVVDAAWANQAGLFSSSSISPSRAPTRRTAGGGADHPRPSRRRRSRRRRGRA